ncbi:MAG TPA: 30S ribosome-binding factor RbfA [candidate division Zixibacteria bacterium]|nr:30S ribosome-binding factor RbfA [candidate division Zixibacteria bacterium]
MRQYNRSDRVSEELRKTISRIIESEYEGSIPGMVTFTRVKLSKDLRNATVYYSFLGSAEDRESVGLFLERERKHIRYLVGREMHIRHSPELLFRFDPSIEEGIRIEELLNQINREKQEREE